MLVHQDSYQKETVFGFFNGLTQPHYFISLQEDGGVASKVISNITLQCITFILHYITLHYITLHYITLHYITLHYITLHYITLHYITLHYITLHYITLHYITSHYITLHFTFLSEKIPQLKCHLESFGIY